MPTRDVPPAPPYDRAPYWGFQLCNFWREPMDYVVHWTHRNNATVVADDEGSVRTTFTVRFQRSRRMS